MRLRPSSLREWVAAIFAAIGIGLLPWTILLAEWLPPKHASVRWDLAWSGFDSALALSFLVTAAAVWLRSPWVGACAAATGTLLVTDAWFDVILESHSDELRISIATAVFGELPAAALCFWIAFRTEQFLARIVDQALGRGTASHLAASGQGPAEGDFVGVLEVAPDGQAAGEPGDEHAPP